MISIADDIYNHSTDINKIDMSGLPADLVKMLNIKAARPSLNKDVIEIINSTKSKSASISVLILALYVKRSEVLKKQRVAATCAYLVKMGKLYRVGLAVYSTQQGESK